MNRIAEAISGLSISALLQLPRLGARKFARLCRAASGQGKEFGLFPEISLDQILGDRKSILQFTVKRYEDGTLPNNQIMTLLAILVAEQPKTILEIGTYMGNTTRLMAEHLPNGHVHTVDLPLFSSGETVQDSNLPKDDFHLIHSRIVGRDYKGTACESRITQHFADTASWDFSAVQPVDFFFIDGSHSYEYCKNDSEKCLQISSPGATFIWHDYDITHPGVMQFVREWRGQGRDIRRIAGTPLGYWRKN